MVRVGVLRVRGRVGCKGKDECYCRRTERNPGCFSTGDGDTDAKLRCLILKEEERKKEPWMGPKNARKVAYLYSLCLLRITGRRTALNDEAEEFVKFCKNNLPSGVLHLAGQVLYSPGGSQSGPVEGVLDLQDGPTRAPDFSHERLERANHFLLCFLSIPIAQELGE